MYWLKQKLVLPRVNPSNAQKTHSSIVEMVYGVNGLKKYAMLQIAHMPFALKGACFQEESVEKP
jgi:hypothetical protein